MIHARQLRVSHGPTGFFQSIGKAAGLLNWNAAIRIAVNDPERDLQTTCEGCMWARRGQKWMALPQNFPLSCRVWQVQYKVKEGRICQIMLTILCQVILEVTLPEPPGHVFQVRLRVPSFGLPLKHRLMGL